MGLILKVAVAPDVNTPTLVKIIEGIYKSHLAVQSVKIDESGDMLTCMHCHKKFPHPTNAEVNRYGEWIGLFCSKACHSKGVKVPS